ncbi:hypothetical protein EDD17DRAFT_1766908 [Pisolithus thermaeus]|nr:hypothetical protein EDD17DRAFT_1766908 [Pisolithus thermaeus]
MALNSVMKDFQVQKDALGEMETVLQERETELTSLHAELETHAKECAAHQEQLYNEQQLAMQQNHSQLEEFQRQLKLKLQSQMEKMSTSQAANLEAHVQEVTRLRESFQAEKEREMAKLKQEVTWLRESLQDEEVKLEKESEPAVHWDFILAVVHHLFKEKLGITQDLDFIMHHPATAEDIHAYEYEDGFGPDQNNLLFDLTQNYSSPWNTYILKLLCQELQACCKEKNWPIKRGNNYIMEILQECYK